MCSPLPGLSAKKGAAYHHGCLRQDPWVHFNPLLQLGSHVGAAGSESPGAAQPGWLLMSAACSDLRAGPGLARGVRAQRAVSAV